MNNLYKNQLASNITYNNAVIQAPYTDLSIRTNSQKTSLKN